MTAPDAWGPLASAVRLGLATVNDIPPRALTVNQAAISALFEEVGLDLSDSQVTLAVWATIQTCLTVIATTCRAMPLSTGEVQVMGHPLRVVAVSLVDQVPHEAIDAVAARGRR